MLSYLEKYKNLSPEIKEKVAAPEIMQAVADLEKKYHISLATVIMRVMVQDLSIVDLPKFFVFEDSMSGTDAHKLTEDLKELVFYNVAEYLNIKTSKSFFENEEKNNLANLNQDNDQSEKGIVETSNFFFSSEDEAEILKLSKKIQNYEPENKKRNHLIEQKIDQVLAAVNISFSSTEMFNRFRNLTGTYLRNVRNKIDIRQSMIKSIENGGLGVDEMVADKLLTIIEKVKKGESLNNDELKKEKNIPKKGTEQVKQINQSQRIVEIENKENKKDNLKPKNNLNNVKEKINKISQRDVEYDFSKLLKQKKKKEFIKIEKKDEKIEEKKQKQKVFEENGFVIQAEQKNDEKKEQKSEQKFDDMVLDLQEKNNVSTSLVKVRNMQLTKRKSRELVVYSDDEKDNLKKQKFLKKINQEKDIQNNKLENLKKNENKKFKNKSQQIAEIKSVGKIKMSDVQYHPKLSGPIDELEQINLVDFRRFDADPFQAILKIEEKLKFLEEDSYSKRLAGLKAWRKSSLHRMYLKVGQESIAQKKSINEILSQNKKDFLTEKEFSAIMELNKKIKY